MIQRPIYEYPKELLWHSRSIKWYLENDPNGLHKEMADTLFEMRKEGCNIEDIAEIINDAYRIAVIIASTDEPKYSNLAKILYKKYPNDESLLCGCTILLSQVNNKKYIDTIDEITEIIGSNFKTSPFDINGFEYQSFKNRILDIHKSGLHTDLSPDAFVEDDQTVQWLIKNMSSLEFETIIGFHRTKKSQLDFLNVIIASLFVEEELAF